MAPPSIAASKIEIESAHPLPVAQEEVQHQTWPIPQLHLQALDLSSPGSGTFFANVDVPAILKESVIRVLGNLYTLENAPKNVRSISLILREMNGVAYTQGSHLDDDHKEIHFSTAYIHSVASRAHDEIFGVLVHEIVHCFQYNANGTCPGGLIEGIADWVRLKAGLSPPHWRRGGGTAWDQGYEITGYFLDWIDRRYWSDAPTKVPPQPNSTSTPRWGFVQELNQAMRTLDYYENIFNQLTGKPVQELWEEYQSEIESEGEAVKVEHSK